MFAWYTAMRPAALRDLRFIASGPLYTGLLNASALAELRAAGYVEIVEGVIGLDVAQVTDSGMAAMREHPICAPRNGTREAA